MAWPSRLNSRASSFSARAMPTAFARPCPSGPVVVSTPGVRPVSGWPGVLLCSWRKFFSSDIGKAYPVRCSSAYRSMDAWPFDNTKRSRSNQCGLRGLCFRWPPGTPSAERGPHKATAMSAMPMGAPGWPELACCTASIASARMALAMVWGVVMRGMAPEMVVGPGWVLARFYRPSRWCPVEAPKLPTRHGRDLSSCGSESLGVCRTVLANFDLRTKPGHSP